MNQTTILKTMKRAEWIIQAAKNSTANRTALSHLEDVRLCGAGYCEPGYRDPESGVIATGNWNSISQWDAKGQTSTTVDETLPRVAKLLEKSGVELEWSDEWTQCNDCGRLVREQADSYCWKRSFAILDGDVVCHECLAKDPAPYLESLENNDETALTMDIDPAQHGYRKLNEESYENGLYGGQSANPALIAKALREQGVKRFLFVIDGTGQFDTHFSVWVHESETVNEEAFRESRVDGPDPAKELEVALKTAKPVTITPQEFVEGTWYKRKDSAQ